MTQASEYKGPLADLNVIDFGHYYAGPLVGMLLADQGANVIRIVRPGEPELPSPQYRVLNRNKQLLALDLKSAAGQCQARSLIERADVLIENFRPGVMQRFELDYSRLKGTNPDLIYLSLPGFASTDPERAHIQAWEGVIAAAACGYTHSNLARDPLNFPPVYTWVPQASVHGALNGATAVMAALLARQKTGIGSFIEAPLASASLAAFDFVFMGASLPGPPAGVPDALKPLIYAPEDSEETQLNKLEAMKNRLYPLNSNSYRCADGRKIYVSFYFNHQFAKRFFKALGIYQQVMNEGFIIESAWEPGLENNVHNLGAMGAERKDRLRELIAETLLTKAAAEWETRLGDAGVPAAVVRTKEEWLALKPMRDSGVLVRMKNGESDLVAPGRVADVSGPDGAAMPVAPKEAVTVTLDKAASSLQGRAATAARAVGAKPLKKGELLKGLKVLDMANVIAGPSSALNLAQYGADVIKLDPPYPDHYHPSIRWTTLMIDQGKRSAVINVKSTPGREILCKLVAWADVVVHNVLDDTAERLGVSHAELTAINPNVVTCQMSAYGGSLRGFWENRGSFDNLLQATSGLQAQWGTLEKPFDHGGITCGDVPGGITSAFAILLALYQQCRTGCAGEARTSLARVMSYAQLPFMICENGRSNWGSASGQFAVGESWHQRLYRCTDGWIYVETPTELAGLLAETIAPPDKLEAVFAELSCAHWLAVLNEVGIACHRVLNAKDHRAAGERPVGNDGAEQSAHGTFDIIRYDDHPCGFPVVAVAPDHVRIGEEGSYKLMKPCPRTGEHTREVLGELGYSDDQIEELVRLKVAHDYYPPLGSTRAFLFPVENQQ